MDNLSQLTRLIDRLINDGRLTPTHFALLLALSHCAIMNDFEFPLQVSRAKLMKLSKIHSRSTYHRVVKELRRFGYLKYYPSYHPVNGSKATLVM